MYIVWYRIAPFYTLNVRCENEFVYVSMALVSKEIYLSSLSQLTNTIMFTDRDRQTDREVFPYCSNYISFPHFANFFNARIHNQAKYIF